MVPEDADAGLERSTQRRHKHDREIEVVEQRSDARGLLHAQRVQRTIDQEPRTTDTVLGGERFLGT